MNTTCDVDVVGVHWGAYLAQGNLIPIQEPVAAYTYKIPVENARTREEVQSWLDRHAGDFEVVMDFRVPDTEIPWQDEENECVFVDIMYGGIA